MRNRSGLGGGWLGWVVAVPDIGEVERRLGLEAVEGNRRRPDGHELRWKQIGGLGLQSDPQLPFFVQWLSSTADHPSIGGEDSPIHLEALQIAGDPGRVSDWLGLPVEGLLEDVKLEWVQDLPGHGIVAAHFHTPAGLVRV